MPWTRQASRQGVHAPAQATLPEAVARGVSTRVAVPLPARGTPLALVPVPWWSGLSPDAPHTGRSPPTDNLRWMRRPDHAQQDWCHRSRCTQRSVARRYRALLLEVSEVRGECGADDGPAAGDADALQPGDR